MMILDPNEQQRRQRGARTPPQPGMGGGDGMQAMTQPQAQPTGDRQETPRLGALPGTAAFDQTRQQLPGQPQVQQGMQARPMAQPPMPQLGGMPVSMEQNAQNKPGQGYQALQGGVMPATFGGGGLQLNMAGQGYQAAGTPMVNMQQQGSPLTAFSATDNLRGQQINPYAGPRLRGTQGAVDAASQALQGGAMPRFGQIMPQGDPRVGALEGSAMGDVAGAQSNPFESIGVGSYNRANDTARARELTGQGLESLYNAPNRQQLAEQSLQAFIQQTEPDARRRMQDVGRSAASLGRIGSGMTADDAWRVGNSREQEIVQEAGRLARETAGMELGDRLNRLGASQGVAGQFQDSDLADAGFQQGLRGEARGERQDFQNYGFNNADLSLRRGAQRNQLAGDMFARGQSYRDEGRREADRMFNADLAGEDVRRGRLNDLMGLEDQQYRQGFDARNELRGERDFQNNMSRQAQEDRIRQIMMEDELMNSDERRQLGRIGMTGQFGFGGNPSSTYMQGANGAMDMGGMGLGALGALGQANGPGGGIDINAILQSLGIGGGGNRPGTPPINGNRPVMEEGDYYLPQDIYNPRRGR